MAGPTTTAVRPASAQNVLLALGGILLGIAAIVFVVVAWSAFGLMGRAVLLAGVTGGLLLAPLLLVRRDLTATAETLAAVGLLLLPLDGYAARVAGFAPWPRSAGYAAGVFAVTALLAVGYRAVSGLRVAEYAALLAAQPVAPLLAGEFRADMAGWSLAFTCTVAIDMAVAWPWRTIAKHPGTEPPSVRPRFTPPRAIAACLAGVGMVLAGMSALVPLFLGAGHEVPVGAAALLIAAVPAGVWALATKGAARGILASAVALAVVLVTARLVWLVFPGQRFLGLVTAMAMLTCAALVLRGAARVGALVVTGAAAALTAVTTVAVTLGVGVAAVLAATPVWGVTADAYPQRVNDILDLDWQVPAALVVLVAAALVILSVTATATATTPTLRPRVAIPLLGVGLLALATSPAFSLPYITFPLATGLAALLYGGYAVTEGKSVIGHTGALGGPAALLWAGGGAVLGVHAVAVCLATRPATVLGLTGAMVAAAVVALIGRTSTTVVGVLSCGVSLFTLPGVAATAVYAAGGSAWLTGVTAMVAAAGACAVTWLLRGTKYAHGAALGVVGGATVSALAMTFSTQPSTMYFACGALLGVTAILLPAVRVRWLLVWPAISLAWAALGTAPLVFSALIEPYAQLADLWGGPPGRTDARIVGLGSLILVALAGTLFGYGLLGRRAWPAIGVPLGVLTLIVFPVAVAAPWPVAAVTALALGLGAGGYPALRPPRGRHTLGPLGSPHTLVERHLGLLLVAALGVGAGLAGLSATRVGTLSGLSALLGTSVLVALTGRSTAARSTGWAVASIAWWLLLASAHVSVPEAYTLPPALIVLTLGVRAAHRRPELGSWLGYGPGLLAAFLPSLAWSLPLDSLPIRRLLLGGAAVAVVILGARARLRAPLVIGSAVLLVLAVHELLLIGVAASYWIPLAIAGTLLVVCGATYERRLRDIRRLRDLYESYR